MERQITLQNYYTEYRKKLNNLLDEVDINILSQIVDAIIDTFKAGKTLYVCGNGGSAATASHICTDFGFFVRNFTKFRPKVRALTDNVPMITAISNDISYNDIFVEQLKGIFEEGDTIICISVSGNSENVIRAARYANEMNGTSIAFVGFTGGNLHKIAKLSLFTPNHSGDYGPIEDLHMIYDHLIVNFLTIDKEFLAIPE